MHYDQTIDSTALLPTSDAIQMRTLNKSCATDQCEEVYLLTTIPDQWEIHYVNQFGGEF